MVKAAIRSGQFPRVACAMVLLLLVVGCGRARAETPVGPTTAPATQPGRHVRLLAVGNSFSHDATAQLAAIAEAAGHELTLGHASLGGCSMERHWRHAAAFEADPNDPNGRPYGPPDQRYSLREALTREPWDYVTIQQFSNHSYRLETFRPYAGQLAEYIRTHAPQAELLVHQTWAYESDDPMFQGDGKMTPLAMYEGLREAYGTIAGELGARILPVGDAMQLARQDPGWQVGPRDPDYDFDHPVPPNLPRQSPRLTVGYAWRKNKEGKDTLVHDAHHASTAGRYLGAAVWFEVLYEQSVVGNSYVPKGMSEEDVRFLQEVAHRAVAAQKQTQTAR